MALALGNSTHDKRHLGSRPHSRKALGNRHLAAVRMVTGNLAINWHMISGLTNLAELATRWSLKVKKTRFRNVKKIFAASS